ITPLEQSITRGRFSFFNETFNGNGRTCGTCHREDNNLTIDPAFIATLPPNDPLFVAETNPDLSANFENPVLMRQFGLILENPDFRLPTTAELDDLEAFQRSMGRRADLVLTGPGALSLKDAVAAQGQTLFLTRRCQGCHSNAGASNNGTTNRNFNTGVENFPI